MSTVFQHVIGVPDSCDKMRAESATVPMRFIFKLNAKQFTVFLPFLSHRFCFTFLLRKLLHELIDSLL